MRLTEVYRGKSWLLWNLNERISEYLLYEEVFPAKTFTISHLLLEDYLYVSTPGLHAFKPLDEEYAYKMIHEIRIKFPFVVRKHDVKKGIPYFNLVLKKELPTHVMF